LAEAIVVGPDGAPSKTAILSNPASSLQYGVATIVEVLGTWDAEEVLRITI